MKNSKFLNKIICADSLKFLPKLKENSIDAVITDPPYFLDKLDDNWNCKQVAEKKDYCHVIKSLPAGMKFDREQGKKFYEWYLKISKELFRVIKPGGFFFSFSSPRLYHRMACAVDDAGFEIRDSFIWLYTQNQAKAMSLNHFIDKMRVSDFEKNVLKNKLNGWKTPQIKSCFEPISMAQKPTDGTYLENMQKHEVGLLNTNLKIGENMYPANVVSTQQMHSIIDKAFLLPKPAKKEKGEYNDHKTVKPVEICEYLIELSAFKKDAVILDPFVGSGTTVLAAKKMHKNYIGIDLNKDYTKIAEKRLKELSGNYSSKEPNLFSRLA
jgi:site-specific DNA-methyltransferase (adenine-specific)